MADNVAEVTVEVGFESSTRAVFTLSASGQLCPSQADGDRIEARYWVRASDQLKQFGLRPPDPGSSVRTPDGMICWPWSDDGQLDGIDVLAEQYAGLEVKGSRITSEEAIRRGEIVKTVAGFTALQTTYFCQQLAQRQGNAASICQALTVLGNRVNDVCD